MNRRQLLMGLAALPASSTLGIRRSGRAASSLASSGPVVSSADGELIENLDIKAGAANGITIVHRRVTVRNCRIRHMRGHGVHAENVTELALQDLEIDHVGAPPMGAAASEHCNNIDLDGCPGAIITRVKASRGSSNIYLEHSRGSRLSFLELHDARGPFPRGQNVQFNHSPDSILQDFSSENGPTSWTEDNISVFCSNGCIVRRGLVFYNNSPTGDGVMIEGSFDCLVEDVDALQQGNGAFAAVPQDEVGSGGCTFLRCRTAHSYNAPRDGRAAPSSNGLSIYTQISAGARKHTITDCHYNDLANPSNLIWDLKAVNAGWSFTPAAFTPRRPLRLAFGW